MPDYFIDSHCHMHDTAFFEPSKMPKLLERAETANVRKIIFIGTDYEDSFQARDYALQQDPKRQKLYWSYGVHPSEHARPRQDPDFGQNLPIAIGEVGLDYHFLSEVTDIGAEKTAQKQMLKKMLALAKKWNLPLIFHVREAFDDFFEIIDTYEGLHGVVHSFTDSKKNLKKCLERGFYVGVNGLATYSTLPTPPLDKILLETDAPFLAPVPHRGEQNESAYIPDVAAWLAQKLGVSTEDVMHQTSQNCLDLFGF